MGQTIIEKLITQNIYNSQNNSQYRTQAGIQAGNQAGIQTDTQADIQAGNQANSLNTELTTPGAESASSHGCKPVSAGDIVTVNVDRVMIHDIFIPFVSEKFEEMGFSNIWDPNKVVLIYDHLVPASQQDDVRHFKIGDAFALKYGMKNVHRSDGICHQLMTEAGYVKPGDVVFGTDSHTTTYGCVGAFSSGIGYTEMASILGTGTMWIKVPETIKVIINGALPKNVSAKDIILTLIGDLGSDGATYKALEFSGSTIDEMSISSRMTIANMAVEAGAKCALFSPDEKTAKYCNITLSNNHKHLVGDENATYCKTLTYSAEKLVPVMACPSQVDKICPVSDLEGTPIDQVFIGSCTNGRFEDLQVAAKILEGKNISPFVKLIVTPASRKVFTDASNAGIIKTLLSAGAIVTHPGCGLCCGRTGGILADHEVVVATNNRNFLGRMGTSKVQIYLASPASAAMSALTGKITTP
ncbi:MAG: aconitase/3-isopropylmalate dehydratase large subunit family protein [Aminipila sp.]